jgi:hypothetical protein
MKSYFSIICLAAILSISFSLHAYEEKDADVTEEQAYEDVDREYGQLVGKKSVATAALLSVIPGFGAGLYYAGEYTAAISSTVAQATGLGLFLDAQLRTHNDGMKITGLTMMGTSWLFGVIYAPIAVHQHNKWVGEKYGLNPYVGFSDKSLYAGVGFVY